MARSAEDVAKSYHLILDEEPGMGFVGRTVEMPLVMADGPTREACSRATIEATTAVIEMLLEKGAAPPAPAW